MIRSRRVDRRAVAVVAVVLALASCSGGGDDDAEASENTTTTTTAETTAPPTTLSVEEEVEAAYRELDALSAELSQAPNPDDPRLPEMVLEPQLSEMRDSLAEAAAKNEIYEVSPLTTYEILDTKVAPTGLTATLTICAVGDDKVIDMDTGDVVQEGTYTLKDEASYRKEDGRWKLEEYLTLDSWEGITSCEG